MRLSLRLLAASLIAATTATALAACGTIASTSRAVIGHVSTQTRPGAKPAAAAARPAIIITIRPTIILRPDLTIGQARANDCTLETDSDNTVWLVPLVEERGTGFGVPATAGFSMTTNWAKWTAGGTLSTNVATPWAIQIGTTASTPAFGHILLLTMNADPVGTVAESNESNNTTVVTVDLTGVSSPPVGAAEPYVPCS